MEEEGVAVTRNSYNTLYWFTRRKSTRQYLFLFMFSLLLRVPVDAVTNSAILFFSFLIQGAF